MTWGAVSGDWLCFRVGSHRCSLPATAVARVAELDALRTLPALPGVICGIASHRGRVLTVVDLAALLGRSRSAGPRTTWTVVILHHPARHVGLWVDAVEDLREAEAPGDAASAASAAADPVEALEVARLLEDLDACVRER